MAITKLVVALFFSLCVLISAAPTKTKYCSETNYAVKIIGADITPYPIQRGDNATFSITAATEKNMAGGKLVINVLYYGIDFYTEDHDICAETSCPIAPGSFVLSHTQKLPKYMPTGDFSLKMSMHDEEDNELTCITFDFSIGNGIGLIAKSMGVRPSFLI